jgi:hypothetical protein
MREKRAVEHYRGHELVVEAVTAAGQWHYIVSVVSHAGDDSEAMTEESVQGFHSDIEALHEGKQHGRKLIDDLCAA